MKPNTITRGLAICWCLNVLAFLLGLVLLVTAQGAFASVGFLLTSVIGVGQFLYVLPLYYSKKTHEPLTAEGISIAASITALLNASCAGIVFVLFR